MWHLLMAHQQESFLPFSSRQSLSYFLSHMAKGRIPESHGPNSRPSQVVLSLLHQSCVVLSWHGYHGVPTQPKPHGPNSRPSHVVPTYSTKAAWSSLVWLPCLGLNLSTSLPLQPHFQLLLQSVTPASIPYSSSFTGLPL